MADPTTIFDYATKRRDDAQTAVTNAQQQLTAAQGSVAAQSDALALATTALADLERQAAAIRQKLSAVPTPADADALVAALEEITIRIRTGEGSIVKAQAELLVAQVEAERAQTVVANATTRLTEAEAALKQANQDAQERAARAVVLGGPPLSTIATDATNALDETTLPEGENYRAAKARLTTDTVDRKADIPDKLFKRAKNRRDNALALTTQADSDVQAALNAVFKEQNDNGGLAGVAQKVWALFQQAEANVEEFVTTAKARFDKAQANLARVADLDNDPLTAEQSDRINDAGLKASRETAVDKEKDRDDKGKAVVTKRAALDVEILKALAAGKLPDTVTAVQTKTNAWNDAKNDFATADNAWRLDEKNRDAKLDAVAAREKELQQKIDAAVAAHNDPETDPDVIAAKDNLKTAQIDLSVAENNYRQSPHFVLHAWEAAVPDSMWRLFEDFEEAEDILNALKNASPTTLQSDLVAAEADYVAAQLAADVSESKVANLSAEQARREVLLKTDRQSAANRTFGALRGDN
jgi:hypothetical protein